MATTENEPKLECDGVWKIYPQSVEQEFKSLDKNASIEDRTDFLASRNAICAVQNVNLSIHAGEVFVIMGLSGSGKSTLIRCLSRLIEPSAGHVRLDGHDLLGMERDELVDIRRHKIGMVFQHFALLPYRTVLGNVAFPLEIQGINQEEREERAREMISLVGLGGRESYYPRELSGGQQQRVGIARSLAVEPELWFLDEPFSALDPLIRREMQDEFLRLQSMLNKTIVFITHDFEEAIRLADRIAIMKDGRVIQISTPEDLILNPADDYVAAFTKHVSRAKVLRVENIMRPPVRQVDGAPQLVSARSRVIDAASLLRGNSDSMLVGDEKQRVVGEVHWNDVLDVLVA